jgi:flagella basal body P-ring formation protein FlgA
MRHIAAIFVLLLLFAGVLPAGAGAQTWTQRIAGSRLTSIASRVLRALPADPNAQPILSNVVADQFVGPGAVALSPQAALVTSAFINVPIAIELDGRIDRVVYVGYRIQHFVRTAVAAHDLAPGSVLGASDLTLARIASTGHTINSTGVLIGRRLIGAISAGQPVYLDRTQVDQIVKAGATVIMIIKDGGVSLVADVVARTSGGLGDQVSVYSTSTNKMLSGTVVGPDRVELNIDPGATL